MAASIKHLDSNGATQITAVNFADAVAGVLQTAKKLGAENSGDRVLSTLTAALQAIGGTDGASLLRIAIDTVTLSKPWGLSTVLSGAGAGGVWGATGTYGYVLTATNALGETIQSIEVTATVDVTTKTVTVNWVQVPNATGYKLYRTPTPGTYGASTLRATIGSGATVTFLDDGSATTTGTPSLTNTTAGWNLGLVLSGSGAGGIWGATGVYFYEVAAFDASGGLLTISQEASINVDDATKTVTISWSAVTGATSYNVYRTQLQGNYTATTFVATTTGLNVVDNGAATTAGGLTLGSSFGIPPTLGAGPISFGDRAIAQQGFYWINRVIPSATPETGNPRSALVDFSENV